MSSEVDVSSISCEAQPAGGSSLSHERESPDTLHVREVLDRSAMSIVATVQSVINQPTKGVRSPEAIMDLVVTLMPELAAGEMVYPVLCALNYALFSPAWPFPVLRTNPHVVASLLLMARRKCKSSSEAEISHGALLEASLHSLDAWEDVLQEHGRAIHREKLARDLSARLCCRRALRLWSRKVTRRGEFKALRAFFTLWLIIGSMALRKRMRALTITWRIERTRRLFWQWWGIRQRRATWAEVQGRLTQRVFHIWRMKYSAGVVQRYVRNHRASAAFQTWKDATKVSMVQRAKAGVLWRRWRLREKEQKLSRILLSRRVMARWTRWTKGHSFSRHRALRASWRLWVRKIAFQRVAEQLHRTTLQRCFSKWCSHSQFHKGHIAVRASAAHTVMRRAWLRWRRQYLKRPLKRRIHEIALNFVRRIALQKALHRWSSRANASRMCRIITAHRRMCHLTGGMLQWRLALCRRQRLHRVLAQWYAKSKIFRTRNLALEDLAGKVSRRRCLRGVYTKWFVRYVEVKALRALAIYENIVMDE